LAFLVTLIEVIRVCIFGTFQNLHASEQSNPNGLKEWRKLLVAALT